VQVHGGMGYVEETGAAQHLRDARIAPIYEGTNGIQANDLVARKIGRDGGAAAQELIAEMKQLADRLKDATGDDLPFIGSQLVNGLIALAAATHWMSRAVESAMPEALAGSVPYLRLFGNVTAGWLLAKGALAAQRALADRTGDARLLEAKLRTARLFAEHCLALTPGMLAAIKAGDTVLRFDPDEL